MHHGKTEGNIESKHKWRRTLLSSARRRIASTIGRSEHGGRKHDSSHAALFAIPCTGRKHTPRALAYDASSEVDSHREGRVVHVSRGEEDKPCESDNRQPEILDVFAA